MLPTHAFARWLRRPELLLAGLCIAVWGTLVVTYRPFADGLDRNAYLLSSTVLAWVPCVGYALLRLFVSYGHPFPLLVAVALALGGGTPHWLRLAATADAAAPRLEYGVEFGGPGLPHGWEMDVAPGGQVSVVEGRLRVETPAGSIAHANTTLQLPTPPPARPWRPAGFAAHPRVQVIEWSSRVAMDGSFFVIADLEHLLLQTVPHGIHITYWPPGGEGYGTEIEHPLGQDRRWHRWRIVRDERQIEVSVDDKPVWTAPFGAPFRLVRLGESRSDELHGGRLEVERFHYRVYLAREHAAAQIALFPGD